MKINTRKKIYKKKRISKKIVVTKRSPSVVRPKVSASLGVGFPKRLQFTHKYVCDVAFTAATGILGKYVFSCNGIYDPDITGSGLQPAYFDQMALLYNHYHVIGSRCKITALPITTNNPSCAYGLIVNDDTTIATSAYYSVAEQSQSKVRYMVIGNNEPKSITNSWSAKKYFGGSVLSNNELQGTVAGNPTEQSYFIFYAQAIDGISSIAFQLSVEIEYITVWTELKDIASS